MECFNELTNILKELEKNLNTDTYNKIKTLIENLNINEHQLLPILTYTNKQTESVNILGAKRPNYLVRRLYDDINKNLFENTYTSLNNSPNSTLLKVNNEKLTNFLNGGFKSGKIYELVGHSLSGKSFFLNNLIKSNLEKHNLNINNKVILFDTNYSYFNDQNEAIIHKEVVELGEIISFLNETIQLNQMKDIKFIVIDSLTIIASKLVLTKKENEIKTEFDKIIQFIVNKYGIGVLFTTNPYKSKVRRIIHFTTFKEEQLRESESNLANNIILPVDYSLLFYVPHFSFRCHQTKNRKFMIKIKKEKYHSIDEVIENKLK